MQFGRLHHKTLGTELQWLAMLVTMQKRTNGVQQLVVILFGDVQPLRQPGQLTEDLHGKLKLLGVPAEGGGG